MKTLLVASLALCILPAAFAGDFKEMFAEFEKLKHKVPAASERNFDLRTHRFRYWEDKQEDSRANGEVDLLVDKVRMKTILTEKLEKLTNDYERQRIQFISQTTWRFLKLCPGANNAADLLERLDDETFLEPSNTLNQVNNWTPNITVNTSDAHNQTQLRWFVDLKRDERLQYIMYGMLQVMCGAAQNLAGQVDNYLQQSETENCTTACTREYMPMCGTDGVTYGNACMLNVAICQTNGRVQKAHEGVCS